MEAPTIKPYKTKEFDSKQSQYEHADKLPMRAIALGPSGSGKNNPTSKHDSGCI